MLVGATQVMTVEFWGLVQTDPEPAFKEPQAPGSRVFRQIGDTLTLTATTMERLDKTTAGQVEPLALPPGQCYLRVTAGNGAGQKVFLSFLS